MSENSTMFGLLFQNAQVRELARDSYRLEDLAALLGLLRPYETLRLKRFSIGGAPALTLLDDLCIEAAVSGELMFGWDRDSIMQAIAELIAADDPSLFGGLQIESDAFKKGLLASLSHHMMYQGRFMDIIQGRLSGIGGANRPHIRYNPANLWEVNEAWGNAQNDALGAINFLLFYALNRNKISWEDPDVKPLAAPFVSLLHSFFWKVQVWQDWDFGAWEDNIAEHASSVGVVLAGLREQAKFMQATGWSFSYTAEGNTMRCDLQGVQELIANCERKLLEVLPNESIRGNVGVRNVDVALVDALFLGALSGRPLVDDAMTLTIISNIEKQLMGAIGVSRYPGDVWNGRQNESGVPSAQWSHVSPMLSYILGELYVRTGQESYRARQLFHFNRGIACVNERFHVPEAYIAKSDGRGGWTWVSDANESLAWAQAMVIASFAAMKRSTEFQSAQTRAG